MKRRTRTDLNPSGSATIHSDWASATSSWSWLTAGATGKPSFKGSKSTSPSFLTTPRSSSCRARHCLSSFPSFFHFSFIDEEKALIDKRRKMTPESGVADYELDGYYPLAEVPHFSLKVATYDTIWGHFPDQLLPSSHREGVAQVCTVADDWEVCGIEGPDRCEGKCLGSYFQDHDHQPVTDQQSHELDGQATWILAGLRYSRAGMDHACHLSLHHQNGPLYIFAQQTPRNRRQHHYGL